MTIESVTPQILSPGMTIVGTLVLCAAQQMQVKGINMQFGATAIVEGKDAKFLKRSFALHASDNLQGRSVLEAGRELRLPSKLDVPGRLPVPSVGWKAASATNGCDTIRITWWVRGEVEEVGQGLHLSHSHRYGVPILVKPSAPDPH